MTLKNSFRQERADDMNEKWRAMIHRKGGIYERKDDMRSHFWRDYNRILHSNAYRRLKHKTQVFFATDNDHICTRIEHVNHVAAISYTISKYLGLNTELATAISIGHDLGHPPFGHRGEEVLENLIEKETGEKFWHEKNSLWFIDKIETLPDPSGKEKNLNLTYAVRDGIISHCGEVDDIALYPRREPLELDLIEKASQYPPFTWEGCVVKIADKIAYLGRDIEDALVLKFLSLSQLRELHAIIKNTIGYRVKFREINNTVLIHNFIVNICKESSLENGLRFSEEYLQLLKEVKTFNYNNIYRHHRLENFKEFAALIIGTIFYILLRYYDEKRTLFNLVKQEYFYPLLIETFSDWLIKYTDIDLKMKKLKKYNNQIVFDIAQKKDYVKAAASYISGMTDSFAIKIFQELTSFPLTRDTLNQISR